MSAEFPKSKPDIGTRIRRFFFGLNQDEANQVISRISDEGELKFIMDTSHDLMLEHTAAVKLAKLRAENQELNH